MIRVEIIKSQKDERILQITVEGHAYFDEPGKDIVCAAVSALTIGAINSTEKLLKIDLKPEQSQKNGGYLNWEVPIIGDDQTDDRLQLLMEAMIESLKSIEEDYNRYLRIITKSS